MSSPFPRCETLPPGAGCHATETPCLLAPPNDRFRAPYRRPASPSPGPRFGERFVPQPLGCFRCGPASGSVPLNSYRYSPSVSTLQARVLTRYLRVIFASQFGNFSRNRPQSWRGNGAKTATHIPSERPDGCGRFGPAKSSKLGPMSSATWPYAHPTPKRAAKSAQNCNTDGNSKGENRPNRPEQKYTRKASSCGLHLSLSLLSAGARTIRLGPFPFPMGLRPSHPQSRKRVFPIRACYRRGTSRPRRK